MAKRIILALLLVTLAAGGAFAQVQLSAGFGGNFAFSVDFIPSTYYDYDTTTYHYTTMKPGGGFYVFFDADYVEADVGMLFGYRSGPVDARIDVTYLTLGLYGKYPINFGGFTLSPMLGVQFDVGLSAKYTVAYDYMGDVEFGEWYDRSYYPYSMADYLNRLWVKLGVSADFNLSDTLYFRPSVLYGINFGTKHENDVRERFNVWAKEQGETTFFFYNGLDIRVALGFRF